MTFIGEMKRLKYDKGLCMYKDNELKNKQNVEAFKLYRQITSAQRNKNWKRLRVLERQYDSLIEGINRNRKSINEY